MEKIWVVGKNRVIMQKIYSGENIYSEKIRDSANKYIEIVEKMYSGIYIYIYIYKKNTISNIQLNIKYQKYKNNGKNIKIVNQ